MTRFDGPLSGEKITVVSADGPKVVIQDSDLLFTAHFSRSGHDLILTGDHGKSVVVLDYFSQSDMPALSSPEGATLQPHVVNALAGPMAPGQYAQAGDQQPADSIGKVVTLEGSATAQRTDGTVVQLNVGDQVAQGDVLQTADGSALGLVFVDGTVFSLTGASRMVLDNLVYQAGGSNNSLTFDVVQGTFSFVTGQVAPTGEMRIETPVASLGIRGTTPGGVCANGGPCTFFIAPDPGTTRVGEYVLIGNNGQILQTVNNPNVQYVVSSDGALVEQPLDPSLQEVINKLIAAYEQRQTSNEEEDGDQSDDTQNANASSGGMNGEIDIDGAPVSDMAINDPGTAPDDGSESEVTEPGEVAEAADAAEGQASDLDTSGPTIITQPPPPSVITASLTEDGTAAASGSLDGNVVPQSGTTGAFGSFSVSADGAWTYTLNNSAPSVQALGQGQTDTDSFTVTRSDGAIAIVTITVIGTNDAPVAVADSVGTEFESSTTFTAAELLANDTDIDNPIGDLSIAGVTNGIGGVAVLNLDGSVTFTPDEGFSGTATFTYTVTDGIATSAPVTVSVTVEGSNAPVASPVTLTAIAEDSGARTITEAELLAGVSDPDGPSLTITSLSIATGAGSLVNNEDGTWTYTPAANDDTGVTFNYTVSDGTTPASSTASLDITPVNDAPTASPVTLTAIAENSGGRLITQAELLAGVTDPDGPSLTITSLSISTGGGVLVNNGDGTWTYTPAEDDDSSVTFNYTASDGTLSSSSTASLDITTVNEPPVLTGDLEADINNDASYVLTTDDLGFTDGDGDTDVVFTVSNLVNGSILVDGEIATSFTYADIQNGLVSFEHDGSETSQAYFDVSVEDGNEDGSTPVSQTFTLNVTNYITGDENPNVLNGTAAVDVISGLEDDDTITGNGDDDILIGGAGADTYVWNENDGFDTIMGDNLSQDIVRIEGGPFYDYNFEIDGDDLLIGVTADSDYGWSAGGNLRVEDFFNGGDTIAYLQADLGSLNEFYNPDGEGADARIYFSAGAGTDQGNFHELILGTNGEDVINDIGQGGTNRINGYDGDDVLNASTDIEAGRYILVGGRGDDELNGGANDDELRGGSGSDDIDGGDGYDTLAYHRPASSGEFTHGVFVNLSDTDAIFEFEGGIRTVASGTALDNWWDPLSPTDGVDTISNVEAVLGTEYDDIIIGGSEAERIAGGAGADILDGGGGESGYDTVDYYPPFGSPPVTQGVFVNISSEDATFDFNGELDVTVVAGQALDNWGNTDTIAGFENISGSALDDVLVAGSDYNFIDGGWGDDIIVGGGGYDTLVGGGGSDSFVFGTEWNYAWINDFELGIDVLRLQGDVEITYEAYGDDTIVTLWSGEFATGSVVLVGVTDVEDVSQLLAPPILGDGNPNTIDGTVFNDVIEGGQEDDTLNGRAGRDTYIWNRDDGYDTILADDGNEDIIQINGSFYDYNFRIQGDDLLIGVTDDDSYPNSFADVGGNLRLEDFFLGNDSVAYLEADLGDNNEYYSPDGGNARIYVNLVNGEDQGNYYELILGTSGNDTMTDAGGGGINRFDGYGGNDTITAADGARATLVGGTGEDDLYGADGDDDLRGGADDDYINGGDGYDIVRYDRPAASGDFVHGVFVNLSAATVMYDFNGDETTVLAGEAIDNWGDTDILENIEAVRGSHLADVIFGNDQENLIDGRQGDDVFSGGDGVDTYIWREGDGYDTILANNDSEDIIQINGSFYNYNLEIDGDDLLLGVAADDNWNWSDVGGNIRLEDFFTGNDSIDYLEVDLGGENEYYSPDGGNARIYVSLVNGTDQGNYFELVLGTEAGETLTDAGGTGRNRLEGRGGNDILNASDDGPTTLLGGNGDDELNGGANNDELRGGSGSDDIDGGDGYDVLAYHRPATSGEFFHGVFVNLSDVDATYDFLGESRTIDAHTALDNWWDENTPTDGVDTIVNVEEVLGTYFDDVIIGGSEGERISGGDGADILDGGGGSDNVHYRPPFGSTEPTHGAFVNLSSAAVTYDFDGEERTVNAGQAYDNWGNTDTLFGFENIIGSELGDILVGDSGSNLIDGNNGDDIIVGGGGNDTLEGGGGFDIFVYSDDDQYGDVDTIADFIVGTDYLRLEDGLSIDSISDFGSYSTVYLSNFTTIDLIGVTGVTDPNDLLEPPSFFSMAFMSFDEGGEFDTQIVSTTGPLESDLDNSDASGQRGWGGRGGGHGRRGDEGRTHEFAFVQAAAAVAGVTVVAPQFAHAAEGSSTQPGAEAQHVQAHGDGQGWMPGSIAGQHAGGSIDHSAIQAAVSEPIGNAGSLSASHDRPEITQLRDSGQDAPERTSSNDREWKGAASGENDSGAARAAQHAGNEGGTLPAPQGNGGEGPATSHAAPEPADAQHGGGGWTGASLPDTMPILDFSSLPVGGAGTHSFAEGVHQIELKLPAFESVIDLRHDFFAEIPKHPNAGAIGDGHEGRSGTGEWAHAGVAEFVHNLANDLEAAVQNHDAR